MDSVSLENVGGNNVTGQRGFLFW